MVCKVSEHFQCNELFEFMQVAADGIFQAIIQTVDCRQGFEKRVKTWTLAMALVGSKQATRGSLGGRGPSLVIHST